MYIAHQRKKDSSAREREEASARIGQTTPRIVSPASRTVGENFFGVWPHRQASDTIAARARGGKFVPCVFRENPESLLFFSFWWAGGSGRTWVKSGLDCDNWPEVAGFDRGRSISGWKLRVSSLVPGIGWGRLWGGAMMASSYFESVCVCVFALGKKEKWCCGKLLGKFVR